ncbi:MAG TPA: hypothetical protein VFY90_03990 [Tepidiformaceae bacterium]|nr:hypothetical protein [Tepidiformaceae bacterium]
MANDRAISISGFVFAVATFVGLLLLIGGVAAGSTNNEEAARWLNDSGHRARMLVGCYVMCGGAVAFFVFSSALIRRLRGAGAPSLAADAAQVAAIAFVALTLAAAIAMASGAYAVSSDVEPKPIDPGAVRMSTLGFAIWAIPAALAASAFVVSVSIGALAREALPRWLGLVGLLVAVVMLFGIMFLPSLAVLVWAALVAVVTVVRPESKFVARTTQALA